jgi:hypothetical protein
VRREAVAMGGDPDAALARLAREARLVHYFKLYAAVKRFFATATAKALGGDSPPCTRLRRSEPALATAHIGVARRRQWYESRNRPEFWGARLTQYHVDRRYGGACPPVPRGRIVPATRQ